MMAVENQHLVTPIAYGSRGFSKIFLIENQCLEMEAALQMIGMNAHTVEEVKAMLQNREEAALKRERTLSHAFSQQLFSTVKCVAHLELMSIFPKFSMVY